MTSCLSGHSCIARGLLHDQVSSIRAAVPHSSFGIALDLFGDGSRGLVAETPAKVVQLTTRPPEPHPGLVVRPVMVPVKVNGTLNRA